MSIKIQKYHFWLAFFFFIFGMTFSMIVWTVKSAINTPVYEDKSFMRTYQDVEENFNHIVAANNKFNSKYKSEISINNKTVGMEFSDLLYGQRSLKKKSHNQNMLKVGENKISLSLLDKNSQKSVSNAKIDFQITRPIEDMYDINLNDFKLVNGVYIASATIKKEGNWNIIAKVTVGDDIGYLYVKTNTPIKDK